MIRVTFKVTEINDLSKDGVNNRRVVLTANTGNADGTGLAKKDSRPEASLLDHRALVDGRVELVMDMATQAAYFTMDSMHGIDFASLPATPREGHDRDGREGRDRDGQGQGARDGRGEDQQRVTVNRSGVA